MKRILSGIKPSGEVTLGNYLGAMKRWAELSQRQDAEQFYFVPNLHALTVRQDPKVLAENTLAAVAWLLALGIDPRRSTIYTQSLVPAHSELAWILGNYATMGELSRMTQFKDKSKKGGTEGQLVGLFYYPVLMAADILLYDADEVPVGNDQKQHVELTRDIAERFNNLYGQTFKVPQPTIQDTGARIMDLQDPKKKMSKSDGSDNKGCVFLTEEASSIADKIKRAVTDSENRVTFDTQRPGVANLLSIYALVSGDSITDLEDRYTGKGYAEFKADLAEVVVSELKPVQESFHSLIKDRDQLIAIIQDGSERAAAIAEQKLSQVKAKVGLL